MSCPCHFDVIVSKNGSHLFTASNLHESEKAAAAFSEIQARFPQKEGFKVTCIKWDCSGTEVKSNERTLIPIDIQEHDEDHVQQG